MKTKEPHVIIEGNSQYVLGKCVGSEITFDFNKILIYLNSKGKILFGKSFEIYSEDRDILLKLCTYFIRDQEGCQKLGVDINKGILLSGPVGCGKTSLMELLPYFVPYQKRYELIPTRKVTFQFNNQGFGAIEQYGNNSFYCFDDLGVEPEGRHFGKDCNVMGEVMLSRYDLFCHSERSLRISKNQQLSANLELSSTNEHGSLSGVEVNRNEVKKAPQPILTHATTNLNAQELEERYGNRVRSRMRQMFNLISFDSNCKDKRS